MRTITSLMVAGLCMAVAAVTFAAAPDLLPPASMGVDPGAVVQAQSLEFMDAPQSGNQNFSPTTTDVHLAGGFILPVQDLVPFFGVKTPLKDCQGLAQATKTEVESIIQLGSQMAGYVGAPISPLTPLEVEKQYNIVLEGCKQMPQNEQDDKFSKPSYAQQVIADIRNSAATATDVVFSAQSLDPYTAGFPMTRPGTAGAVISMGPDVGADGILLGLTTSLVDGSKMDKPFNTPLFSSSLELYRLVQNVANKKTLQFSGYSTSWIDRPLQDNTGKMINPNCFTTSLDPKFPVVPKSNADLIKAGCVGERDVAAIVTPHLFTNTNADLEAQSKSMDLVVVSRAAMGDITKLPTKIGYFTVYRRTALIPADTSDFQDLWQFERSVTNAATGIPEPYGAAVLHSWNVQAGKMMDSVLITSNVPQSNRYYIFHYAPNGNPAAEPQPIMVGCVAKAGECIDHGPFGPYRVVTGDLNADRCDDFALTRARITQDPVGGAMTLQFAPYVDVYLQTRVGDGCSGQFAAGTKYEVPAPHPKTTQQIASVVLTDVNKDKRLDLVAADFTYYLNPINKKRENYVYFLDNLGGGLLNTLLGLPKFVVNTRDHDATIGPIDVKTDRHANVGVVLGVPVVREPVVLHPPKVPITIENACATGKVNIPSVCDCIRDMDGDNFGELALQKGAIKEIEIADCSGANVTIPLDTTPITLTDCVTGAQVTQTGRAWLLIWAKLKLPNPGQSGSCDTCADFGGSDVCTGPEAGGVQPCFNPSQKDSDGDGFGDICDTQPNDKSQSVLSRKPIPVAKKRPVIREDRVISLNDGPVIAQRRDLKLAAAVIPDLGNEVTILLNKTSILPTPPPCSNGDLNCICKLNPDLQACKCLADPNAPGCTTAPTPQVTCCLDVCRGDLTAPFPRICDFIRPFNDDIRKITGLCMDVLVPVEGTQYHLSCTMPNAPALDLGNGRAYAQVFKTGQLPKNYFKDWHKPVADDNVLQKPVLLNPADTLVLPGGALDITQLPKAQFDFSPLSAVVPDASLNQAPGIAQIDGVMQIETYLADITNDGGVVAAKQAATVPPVKALLLDIKGYSSPPGCQWAGPDCPSPMANPPSARDFVNAIQAKVTEVQAAGQPVTIDTINDAFKSMNGGPAFLHQEFVVSSALGTLVIPVQNTMGGVSAEGGCGCTITTVPTTANTVLPLLMSIAALAAMLTLRRSTGKKH